MVAALAVSAAVFALLALVTGLVALYAWLEPTYGVFQALSIIGGVLAVIALVLISAAMIVGRGSAGNEKVSATPKTIEVPPSPVPLSVTPTPVDSVVSPSVASAATAGIELFLSLLKRYAHIPRTAPVDDFIRQMEPRVEQGTKEAVNRAATLVQTGNCVTMVAVLGAAMAFGWLLVKTAKRQQIHRSSPAAERFLTKSDPGKYSGPLSSTVS